VLVYFCGIPIDLLICASIKENLCSKFAFMWLNVRVSFGYFGIIFNRYAGMLGAAMGIDVHLWLNISISFIFPYSTKRNIKALSIMWPHLIQGSQVKVNYLL